MNEAISISPWLATVLNTMAEGVLGLDRELRITSANRSAEHLLGWTSEELIGRQVSDLLQARQRDGGVHPESGSPFAWLKDRGELYFIEGVFLRKDGRTVDLEISALALPQKDSETYAIVLLGDIAERKESQAALLKAFADRDTLNQVLETAQGRLLQAEKMASVGHLAAGVAHEINNPIGFVSSNLHTLKEQVADLLSVLSAYQQAETALSAFPNLLDAINTAKDAADLGFLQQDMNNLIDESLEGVGRVRTIVDNLKDFSRVDSADWQYVSLENGLESTLKMLGNEIRGKAEIVRRYCSQPQIECIASQINQVFMNLLLNAAQAIEQSGTITLRTGFDQSEAWVEIEDSGRGIQPEHLEKIFEPFFTTQPIGKGTGLGLSLAYGIIRHHHGSLVASSTLGKGSVFRITLPRRRVDDSLA